MSYHQIVLASSSLSRKSLLERLQIPFTIAIPDVDETPLLHESPAELALRLAQKKAKAVAENYPNAIVIGSDQVIMQDNIRLDKPGNKETAILQLQRVSGKKVLSYTGVCVLNSFTHNLQLHFETYCVTFRELTHTMIENYIERDKPFHCAGSIKAESLGIALFEKMEGEDPTALLGLPLIKLTRMLEKENIKIL